jgi:oligopeptidase A
MDREAGERLGRAWGVVGHLHSVFDVPALARGLQRDAARHLALLCRVGQNLALFEKYKALHDSAEFATLSPVRQRILEHELRDFRLSGAELPDDTESRASRKSRKSNPQLGQVLREPARCHQRPRRVDQRRSGPRRHAGRCASGRARERPPPTASQAGSSPCMPSYLPVLQYADNRELRARMYRAYATRASEFGKSGARQRPADRPHPRAARRRSAHARLPQLRRGVAGAKMADTPEQVLGFLRDLGAKAKPFAEKDLAELQAFAKAELGLDTLEPWDVAYASEKLRRQRYAFSDQEVKQYFPEPKVLDGLFRVIARCSRVRHQARRGAGWHPDVRFFRIEKARERGTVGQFYLDLLRARAPSAAAPGWIRSRAATATPAAHAGGLPGVQLPPPGGWQCGRPPSPTTTCITLFHECGHGLHHLLTQVDELRGVRHPRRGMGRGRTAQPVHGKLLLGMGRAAGMTAHVDTGAPLPRALYDKMIAAKNFQSGMQTVRQLEFGLFDLLPARRFAPGAARARCRSSA